jgi:hypothetical protein
MYVCIFMYTYSYTYTIYHTLPTTHYTPSTHSQNKYDNEDPWFAMSVKDQLEQYHVDGSHTTVTRRKKGTAESISAFSREVAWKAERSERNRIAFICMCKYVYIYVNTLRYSNTYSTTLFTIYTSFLKPYTIHHSPFITQVRKLRRRRPHPRLSRARNHGRGSFRG